MPNAAEYEAMIRQFDSWDKLSGLWNEIKSSKTADWANGKAFEYLVLQAFLPGWWDHPLAVFRQDRE